MVFEPSHRKKVRNSPVKTTRTDGNELLSDVYRIGSSMERVRNDNFGAKEQRKEPSHGRADNSILARTLLMHTVCDSHNLETSLLGDLFVHKNRTQHYG